VPATLEVWDELTDLFARRAGADPRFCWCLWYRLRNKDFSASGAAEKRARLHELVQAGPPPGLVALEHDRAVGWVSLGPRIEFERIEHSRTIPRLEGPEPCWAVVCFVVAREARRRGIAAQLLAGAVEHARASGARAIEAYPIDPSSVPGGRIYDAGAYTGTRSMFERAGFHLAAPTGSRRGAAPRVVMRLELG
jgi:GNAT superfamily N-acetyltransferase